MKEQKTFWSSVQEAARDMADDVVWRRRGVRACVVGLGLCVLMLTVMLARPNWRLVDKENAYAAQICDIDDSRIELKPTEATFFEWGAPAEGFEDIEYVGNSEATTYYLCSAFAVGPYDNQTPNLSFCLPDLGQPRISMMQWPVEADANYGEIQRLYQAGDFLVSTRVDEYKDGFYAKIKFFLPEDLLGDTAEPSVSAAVCDVFEQLLDETGEIVEVRFNDVEYLSTKCQHDLAFDVSVR